MTFNYNEYSVLHGSRVLFCCSKQGSTSIKDVPTFGQCTSSRFSLLDPAIFPTPSTEGVHHLETAINRHSTMRFIIPYLFALFAVLFTFASAAPQSSQLEKRYPTPVLYPRAGTIWRANSPHNVTWFVVFYPL